MTTTATQERSHHILWTVLVGIFLTAAMLAICSAPTEQSMGDAQRVMYVHIAVAWLSLLGFVAMAVCGIGYLLSRNVGWDQWSLAIGEVGWLCSSYTLVTGSLWAHSAWGTWWTWDPRLVTSFILWALYSGNLILRSGLGDAHRRAKLSAVLAIIGVVDVPLVVMATRWFRGIHPVSPEMEPSMRYALLASIAGFTAVMTLLVVRRRTQLHLESRLNELQMLAKERAGSVVSAATPLTSAITLKKGY